MGSYLVKLSARSMTEEDSREVTKLLYMIGDFERISDHAVNLVISAEEMKDKEIVFSEGAMKELHLLYDAIDEIVTMTENAFVSSDMKNAYTVEPLEQVVDYLKEQIRMHHIIRLQKDECTMEHGFILSDVLTNLERVSDHCSNIASCMIEMTEHATLDLHEYLHKVHRGGKDFETMYHYYKDKYALGEKAEAK